MIPLILTQAAGVQGALQQQQGETGADGDAIPFGDFFAGTSEGDKTVDEPGHVPSGLIDLQPDSLVLNGDKTGSAFDKSDDLLADARPFPLHSAALLPFDDAKQPVITAMMADDRPVAGGIRGNASIVPDSDTLLPGPRQGAPVPNLATVAQSVVEGRFPQSGTLLPRAVLQGTDTVQVPTRPAEETVAKGSQPVDVTPVTPRSASGPQLALIGMGDRPQVPDHAKPTEVEKPRQAEALPAPVRAASPPLLTQTAPPPAVVQAKGIIALQTDPVERKSGPAPDDALPVFTASERVMATVSGVTATAPAAGAETARHVAGQIATAVSQQPGKVTEIALNPEELGRVRFSLSATEGTITLSILAERPETNDLLRRHIDVLAQEFRSLGYTTINFSFGAEGHAGSAPQTETDSTHGFDETDDAKPAQATDRMQSPSGLDLRL